MTPDMDEYWRIRSEQRWAVADQLGATKVQDIPLPWMHSWGTVVDIEYPSDRPNVVDLVFADNMRTAETKDARYVEGEDGVWVYPTLPDPMDVN